MLMSIVALFSEAFAHLHPIRASPASALVVNAAASIFGGWDSLLIGNAA